MQEGVKEVGSCGVRTLSVESHDKFCLRYGDLSRKDSSGRQVCLVHLSN